MKRDKNFDVSLDEFLFGGFLKFYAEYSNRVYAGVGQSNKLFVNYRDMLLEQDTNEKKTWEQIINFIFGSCDEEKLVLALNNNNARLTADKRYTNTAPSNMSDLYGEELNIKSSVEHWLRQKLDPNILRFFEEKIFHE